MKLDPKQVRFVAPFLSGLARGRLAFYGDRNAVQLQETALVVEGELLRFHFLGLERFFARALCEWTTVTVPYSRIVRLTYRSRVIVRTLLFSLGIVPAAVGIYALIAAQSSVAELLLILPAFGLALGILGVFVWRRVLPTYTVTFRSKDGKNRRFSFAVRSRAVRREFDAALAALRDAATAHAQEGGGR